MTSDEVRHQLKLISDSPAFAGSSRLSTFLRYIVERALDGTTDGLKEYAIGVDVFDRSDAFDPRTDTIVRVHAGRLRKRLVEYYAGDGKEDPVVIEVPKGGYVPRFRRRVGIASQATIALDRHPTVVGAGENGESQTQAMLKGKRVQATVVVSRLSGYTELVEACSAGTVDTLTSRVRDHAAHIVEQHGGILNQFIGEEFVSLFGVVTSQEDAFVEAAHAALAMHKAIQEMSVDTDQIESRTLGLASGIDTGTIRLREAHNSTQTYQTVGSPARVASALALHAGPNEILASGPINKLLRPTFQTESCRPFQFEGSASLITPYRLIGESKLETQSAADTLPIFVGREHELDELHECLQRVLAGTGQFVSVVGEAGIGKTRLLYEFECQVEKENLTVVTAHCQSSNVHTPLAPFIEALSGLLEKNDSPAGPGIEEELSSRIREIDSGLEPYLPFLLQLLSIPSDIHSIPDELRGESLRLAILEALAATFTLSSRKRPIVLLLEDWHWSDEASRDTLKQLIELIPAHKVMAVVTSRPEYSFDLPSYHLPLRLRPLEVDECHEIARFLLADGPLSEDLQLSLHARTGGNPFFLEELCRALQDELATAEDGDRRAICVAGQQLPKTVQLAIQARLNRLNETDLRILRVAAVIGHEFGHGVLRRVVEDDASLTASLDKLRAAGHIQQTSILPEATFRFHHVLVQEAVYGTLLEHQRRALHKRVGEAIEVLSAEELDRHAEHLALHFESAENWERTVRYAQIATDRSWAMSQFSEALAMLEITERAARRVSPADQSKEILIETLLRQERVCETVGRRDHQEKLLAELVDLLEPRGQSARLADTYVRQGDLYTLRGRFDAAATVLKKALEISRAVSATDLESRVLRSMGFLFYRSDQPRQALPFAEEVIARDRKQEKPRVLLHDLLSLSTLLRSLGQHERALKAAQEAAELVETHSLRDELANTSYLIAEILKERGELSQALDYLQEALDHSPYWHERSLGSARKPGLILVAIANIHFAQGNLEECLQCCQDAIGWGRKSKVADDLAGALRTLGVTLLAMNRYGEALPHFREAQSLYSRMEDLESEAAMQQAAARCAEKQGNLSEAISDTEGVLALRRQRQDRLGELEALESLGRLTHEEGRPTGVPLRFYREALVLAEVLNNGKRKSHLHNAIGILKWKRGEYESALTHYQEALRVCEDLDDVIHTGLMLNSIGVTLHKLGRIAEARATLEAALEHHRKNKNLLLEGYALAALGDILYSQEKYELSIQLYEESLKIRRKLKDRKGEAWMLHHLARARNASGQEDKARGLLEKASAIAFQDDITQLNEACLQLVGSWESSHDLDETASL